LAQWSGVFNGHIYLESIKGLEHKDAMDNYRRANSSIEPTNQGVHKL
jgi:hypothetical protein